MVFLARSQCTFCRCGTRRLEGAKIAYYILWGLCGKIIMTGALKLLRLSRGLDFDSDPA